MTNPRQSNLFTSSAFDKPNCTTTSTHEQRPDLINTESDLTFDSKYSVTLPTTNEPSTTNEKLSPSSPGSPNFPPSSPKHSRTQRVSSSDSSSSSNPSRSRTHSTTAGGIHVTEETVTVHETGLSVEELKEEAEWLRRGRQSRVGSGNGAGLGGGLGLEALPKVEYRS